MPDYNKYLENNNFDGYFQKLNKKLKNKTVIIYGTGELFRFIKNNYNFSTLNIIGVSDLKFHTKDKNSDFMGYKIIPRDEIIDHNPDYILVATLKYTSIVEFFTTNLFKDTKIKIAPLVKRNLWDLIKEVWTN